MSCRLTSHCFEQASMGISGNKEFSQTGCKLSSEHLTDGAEGKLPSPITPPPGAVTGLAMSCYPNKTPPFRQASVRCNPTKQYLIREVTKRVEFVA